MRRARLVLYTNSSYALAMSRFFLPIKSIKFQSQRMTARWEIVKKFPTFEVGTKTTALVRAISPRQLCTIRDILYGMPQGHDPKITEMRCIYSQDRSEGEERPYVLQFNRVTLHKSFSTEEDYLSDINSILWDIRENIEEQADVQILGWKPSFLVLKSVNGNPTFSNLDFLFRLEYTLGKASDILKELCATVWEVSTQTGVLEYEPILHSG